MSGQDLYLELKDNKKSMHSALKEIGRRGRMLAEAEKDYRIGLNKKILTERDKGTPVTIISDICRGSSEIALLRCKRDIAETQYSAAKEALNVYKLEVRTIEAQIEREWNNA